MADIPDIRLRIIVDVANTSALTTLQSGMERVNSAAQRQKTIMQENTAAINPVSKAFQDMSARLADAERKMDAVFRAGVHLQAMGRDLIGVSQKIVSTAQDIVSEYADYDFILRRASVALNTNAEWQTKLDKAIQGTAITLGKFSPKEVANAYYLWGAATGQVVDSQEKLNAITKVVNETLIATAMAGGTVEGNLKGVYGIVQQFGLGLGKTGDVIRVLAVLTERTAADFGDLIGAFTYAGSYLGALRVSFNDTAIVLGIMADAGFRGSKAGRGLSMFFEGITHPSKAAAAALNEAFKATDGLGKSFEKIVFPKGKFIGMRKLTEDLAKATFKMTDVERGRFFATIASNNAVRAMLPLIRSQLDLWDKQIKSGSKLTSILDEQKYSLKTAGQFFNTMTESFMGSMDALIGAFKNSLFPIIQLLAVQIMKFAAPAMEFLKDRFKELADFLEKNPAITELIVKIGAAVAIITAVSGAFLLAAGSMLVFSAGIFLLMNGLMPIIGMFTAIAAAIAYIGIKVATNTSGITDAITNFGGAVVRVLDLMFGGVDGAKRHFGGLASAIDTVVNAGLKFLADMLNNIAGALNRITPEQAKVIGDVVKVLLTLIALNTGLGLFAKALDIVSFGLLSVGGAVKGLGLITTIFGPFLSNAPKLIGAVGGMGGAFVGLLEALGPIGWAILAIGAAVTAFVVAYESNFGGFRDFVNGLVVWFQTNLPTAINTALSTIGGLVSQILSPITDKLPKITEFIQGIVDKLGAAFGPVLTSISTLAGQVFGDMVTAITGAGEEIGKHVQPMVDELSKLGKVIFDFLGPAWDFLTTVIGGALGIIIKLITDFATWLAPYVQGFLDLLLRAWDITFGAIIKVVTAVLTGLMDFITAILKVIRGIFEIFGSALKGDISGVWNGIKTVIGGVLDAIAAIIRTVWNAIVAVLEGIGKAITGIFEFVFGTAPGSLWATITTGIHDVLAAIVKFGGDILTTIGSIPGKVMNIGKDIITGLWNGIVSMKDWIIDKLHDFIMNVVPGPIRDALGISSPSKLMAALGVNIVEGLAQGINNTTDAYEAMMAQAEGIQAIANSAVRDIGAGLATANPGLNIATTSDNYKTIDLNVNVTSPDGSVTGMDIQQLSDLITGSDMVRALEQMATVD